ncbi:hypothetical protein [Undibacterium flavidum]|uniref:Ceramidase n=1 Tax=Undibacterium flavidum TaxID=2762297 RepID=A0ABR6YBX2_9BURK|nr:hypothetical protein [Undibacterium flavidum]MBC3874086.1 hypothetical protein [Undibacterium flavidum]
MRSRLIYLPTFFVVLISVAFLWHGAIPQYAHYHEFADASSCWGIPNALDVLSNLPFAIVGLIGLFGIVRCGHDRKQRSGKGGAQYYAYLAFALSICATCLGSTYYHLAPDDARLFWDRLPIALACASLLVAVHIEAKHASQITGARNRHANFLGYAELLLMLTFAVSSVVWWQHTGDLRLYLGLQVAAIVLVPLWQFIYPVARSQRILFGLAIAGYVLAKLAEIGDAAILVHTGMISGHSIKHLLAAVAAGLILYAWRKNSASLKY